MNDRFLCLGLAFGVLFLGLTLTTLAHGQVEHAPESLVLRFDESAASLDQVSIRAAISQELALTLADDGSEQAATLIVSVTPGGEAQVSYRPARDVLTRSIPITSQSDVPRLVAQLAGNMVRNEAAALIAELQAPQSVQAVPAAEATPTANNVTTAAPLATSSAAITPPDEPYLHNAWIFSVLGSLGMSLIDDDLQFGNLVLQVSKRIERFEIGAGLRLAYGSMPIVAREVGPSDGFAERDAFMGYTVTFPISAEYRVLGGDDAYLQLGIVTGLQTLGFLNESISVASGSDFYWMVGLQMTVGFQLARNHGVMIRISADLLPATQDVDDAAGSYGLEPLSKGVQLGWQIGW